jgi:hypothetical protein
LASASSAFAPDGDAATRNNAADATAAARFQFSWLEQVIGPLPFSPH